MNIPFEEMPDDARIWIYQADRPLTEQEEGFINKSTDTFLKEWAAHGAGLNASFSILYGQFLVIAVDEAIVKASGCSIDKQVRFIQYLETELLLNFMDRNKVAFLQEDNSSDKVTVITASMNELKLKVAEGKIHPKSLTFNNLVQTKGQLEDGWIVAAEDSWLKRYL